VFSTYHFPGEPKLAGVYWSKGWWKRWRQLELQIVQSSTAPVKSSMPTNQHAVFLQAGCPSCRPTNNVKALNGKSHSMDLFTPSSPGVFQLCPWPLIAPSYLGEGCHASHQPADASTPSCLRLLRSYSAFAHCTCIHSYVIGWEI